MLTQDESLAGLAALNREFIARARASGKIELQPVVRFKSFPYRAAGWKTVRRVVAKVEFHLRRARRRGWRTRKALPGERQIRPKDY